MAEKVTIARPYAKAASRRRASSNVWRAGRSCSLPRRPLSPTSASRSSCRARACSPADLVELIAEASGADEHGRNFLNTLAQNRRLPCLPEIAAMYEELRAEVENVADVQVTSAVQLDEAQRSAWPRRSRSA